MVETWRGDTRHHHEVEGLGLVNPLRLAITERSQASEARRIASDLARSAGFSDTQIGAIAIVATEAGNNLAIHASAGEMLLSLVHDDRGPAIELLAIDRGPGMDLSRCLSDGYSTGGTAGTGLGAMRRMATTFDAYSDSGGTVLFARFERDPSRRRDILFGSARAAKPGETACGDNCRVRHAGGMTIVLVADGLGHGQFAADAALEAVNVFGSIEWRGPADAVEQVHQALRSTRGAAVSIAAIDPQAREVHFAGLGNVAGAIIRPSRTQSMVSFNGTAGYQAPKIRQFVYEWDEQAVVVMHTDGLGTSWSLDRYRGLMDCHPTVIAGVLLRDHSRGRDDVTVAVATHGVRWRSH